MIIEVIIAEGDWCMKFTITVHPYGYPVHCNMQLL